MSTVDRTTWVGDHFGVRLFTAASAVGLQLTDLVGLALRRNPRRAHLIVSTVLGKHVAVDPDLVVGTGRLLGELVSRALGAGPTTDWSMLIGTAVNAAEPLPLGAALDAARVDRPASAAVVLGFAETATSLGHLVADQLRARWYLHSTRRQVPGVEVAGSFEEGHSHATSHLLLPLPSTLLDTDDPLVLVDDELSTGGTAMGTIAEAHRRHPRSHYVVASLIDLRSAADEAEMCSLATRLGCRIDVVALVRGTVELPDALIGTVADRLRELDRAPVADHRSFSPSAVARTDIGWPAEVPDGGRHGFGWSDSVRFEHALDRAGRQLATVIESRLSSAGRNVLVVGTEEFMYLPLRLAQVIGRNLSVSVRFQSSTRSPALAVDDGGYPIRRQFRFADAEGDTEAPRFLYNATFFDAVGRATDPDLVVVLTDSAADTETLCGSDGLVTSLQAAGLAVELVVLGGADPAALAAARSTPGPARTSGLPRPLTGPDFGSYAPDEVQWLLTDLSDADLEGDITDREAAIQAGTAHYAESLPVEFQPDAQYRELFHSTLSESAARLAGAVGLVTELVLRERGSDIVLASLARAGTPIGILMRRWAAFRHDLTIPHYALSIVRGRGIDVTALKYLAAHHDPSKVVFVDGWTGKGAIARELSTALAEIKRTDGLDFSDDLAVLADPGHCVRTFGTRDDFLIASACLNSTVSGLVSRTVLNDAFLSPGQFHGAKFYSNLADGDVSTVLLDAVSAAFPSVRGEVLDRLPALAAADREVTFAGWAAVERIRAEYAVESVNFVKPGVGETTRMLLRRVPWRILVRGPDEPDHAHLRLLAAQRGVPVEVRPDLPYSCVGLIRRLSDSDPGEA